MPLISSFYGILIYMYFSQSEHNPPHIHAVYGEHIAAIEIRTLAILEGALPPKATSMVKEWTEEHRDELLFMWESQEFVKLPPLE